MKLTRAALLSFLIACISFSSTTLGSAEADVLATASNAATGTFGISSATFIAYASTSTTGPNPNGSALTLSNTNAAQYFYIRNTGTVDISSISLTINYSSVPARTDFSRCDVGVAFRALNTCTSGLATAISGSGILNISIAPGAWYAFELDPKKTTTPTISVSVSSTQIRAATVTNS